MMQQDDEDQKPAVNENAGPKIKMGRIGKKKTGATTGPQTKTAAAEVGGLKKVREQAPDDIDTRGNEGFTENDIEFMRQAI